MLTISVVSVFYISLAGIIILLSYKTFMICKYSHAEKSSVGEREFFTNVCLWMSDKVHTLTASAKKYIFSPLYIFIKRNIKLTHRGFTRFVNDARLRRNKSGVAADDDGATSAYLRSILEQKKIIRKKNKVFHSKNL